MVLLASPLTTKRTLGFKFLTHGQYNLLVNDRTGLLVSVCHINPLSSFPFGITARRQELCFAPRQLLLQRTGARGASCTAGEVPAPTSGHLRGRAAGILPLGTPGV